MRPYEIILKKRDGGALSREEIRYFVDGVVGGEFTDYQAAALLMAIYFQGMTPEETAELTRAYVESGEQVDLGRIPGPKVDKHSTGGVGDKTTLVLAPLVAACGLPFAKLSGRGLGHTGGTLDKLESIPGFRIDLGLDRFTRQVREIGLAVAGQTARLVPADKHLYALRDVTATVESVPLIAASVMSKKLAGGADAIVLDIKVGEGAFMHDVSEARRLAEAMLGIGRNLGRRMAAVLSDMDQPLGRAVGNALEVEEAIATLKGEGPEDFTELCLVLATQLVRLGRNSADSSDDSSSEIRQEVEEALRSGRAFEKFRQLLEAQGGDPAVLERPKEVLPQAPVVVPVEAPESGYLARCNALEVGLAAVALGAGRQKKDEPVDPSVGIVLARKVGDAVQQDEPLALIHARSREDAAAAARRFLAACTISSEAPPRPELIKQILT